MSAPEEYVVRTGKPGSVHLAGGFMSEDDAREFASGYTMGTDWTYTVHKLGPAIEPPEPREWVVVNRETGMPMTALLRWSERHRTGHRLVGDSPYRLARVVFEDGAS